MDTYAPIFSRIVDSSLWDEPDYVVKVFLTLMAKKDADHVVRATAYNLARWSRKTEAEVLEALKILASPDKRRLEPQPYGGRRIEKVGDGWLVLNGQHYEDLLRKVNRNIYQARKQREYRARKRVGDVPGVQTAMRMEAAGASQEEIARATDPDMLREGSTTYEIQ